MWSIAAVIAGVLLALTPVTACADGEPQFYIPIAATTLILAPPSANSCPGRIEPGMIFNAESVSAGQWQSPRQEFIYFWSSSGRCLSLAKYFKRSADIKEVGDIPQEFPRNSLIKRMIYKPRRHLIVMYVDLDLLRNKITDKAPAELLHAIGGSLPNEMPLFRFHGPSDRHYERAFW